MNISWSTFETFFLTQFAVTLSVTRFVSYGHINFVCCSALAARGQGGQGVEAATPLPFDAQLNLLLVHLHSDKENHPGKQGMKLPMLITRACVGDEEGTRKLAQVGGSVMLG